MRDAEDFRKAIKGYIDGTSNISKEAVESSVSVFLEQTGLVDKAVGILEDELKCAVCLDVSLDACSTKCKHIFCQFCLVMCPDVENNWLCPMCRSKLSKSEPKRLYVIDTIIDVVMSKHNTQFISEKEQKLLRRYWKALTDYFRMLHQEIGKFLEELKHENGIEKYKQELSDLARKLLLLTELTCSKANEEHIKAKKEELCSSARQIVRQVLQDLKVPVDEIENRPLVRYLSTLRSELTIPQNERDYYNL